MAQPFVAPEARDAVSGHLAGLGLNPVSRDGLLDAVERGMAAGEDDAFELWGRLLAQATSGMVAAIGRVADEIADAVLAPAETLGAGA